MKQDELVNSLERIRKKLCAYMGEHCDCKFMAPENDTICNGSEIGSGCPEIYTAIAIINALTPAELEKINKRVHLDIKPSEKKRKGRKSKIDHETRKIIDALPNEVSFALVNTFVTAIKNVSKQLEFIKHDNPKSTIDRY